MSGPDRSELAEQRRRILAAVGTEPLSGPAVLRLSAADERLLYPALHRLEAEWKLRATWQPDEVGRPRRVYRRRTPLGSRRHAQP